MVSKKEAIKVKKFAYDPSKEPLGSGTYGTVFKGFEIENRKNFVAIKLVHKSLLEHYKNLEELCKRELEVLKTAQGPGILELKDYFATNEGNLYIVTKYYEDGNLAQLMAKYKGKLPPKLAINILKEVAKTFIELKKKLEDEGRKIRILHRDLKPENILMNKEVPVIADFGLSKVVSEEGDVSRNTGGIGTPNYKSPQVLESADYTEKCDVWSMGIVAYEMICGEKPWTAKYDLMMKEAIENNPLKFPPEIEKKTGIRDLIAGMLAIEESDRFDWEQVVDACEQVPEEELA